MYIAVYSNNFLRIREKNKNKNNRAQGNNAGYAYRNNFPIIREPYAILKSKLDVVGCVGNGRFLSVRLPLGSS